MQKVPRKKIASPTCAIAAFVVEYVYVAIDKAALVGEPAVPCNLQSAIAGVMFGRGLIFMEQPGVSGVDIWVFHDGNPRTMSGQE